MSESLNEWVNLRTNGRNSEPMSADEEEWKMRWSFSLTSSSISHRAKAGHGGSGIIREALWAMARLNSARARAQLREALWAMARLASTRARALCYSPYNIYNAVTLALQIYL